MQLPPALTLPFWFDLTPVALSPLFAKGFFILFAVLVIGGAGLRMASKSVRADKYTKQILFRSATIAFFAGLAGFVIYFFTFEEIQFFGARFWFLVWGIGVIIAVVRLLLYVKRDVPLLREREQSRADVNKYLPRRS